MNWLLFCSTEPGSLHSFWGLRSQKDKKRQELASDQRLSSHSQWASQWKTSLHFHSCISSSLASSWSHCLWNSSRPGVPVFRPLTCGITEKSKFLRDSLWFPLQATFIYVTDIGHWCILNDGVLWPWTHFSCFPCHSSLGTCDKHTGLLTSCHHNLLEFYDG